MEETSLLAVLRQKQPFKIITSLLENRELCRLSMLNTGYQKLLKNKYKKEVVLVEDYISQQIQESTKKKQGKKDEEVKIVKEETYDLVRTSIWSCPSEIFQTRKNWCHVKGELPIQAVHLQEKFSTGIYSIFRHKNNPNELFMINRSLVDRSLEYDKGGFQDETTEELYEHLYESKQLVEGFDFTSQASLLERQKKILQTINEKKNKIEVEEKQCFEASMENLRTVKRIGVILCFGGYFSMALYEKNRCIIHKSDHKYVCRKKAGGRQLAKDKSTGGTISSMGADIRRHQEKLHQEKVSNILTDNFAELQKCDIIFLQAPGINKLILINEDEVLYKLRHKLRSICLTARKANYTEAQRIYEEITKVYLIRLT